MAPKIQPRIELPSNVKWSLTLDRETEEKVWEILRQSRFQNDIVEYGSEKPTEIFAFVNPGYNYQEAGFVLLAAVYCATKPFTELIKFPSWFRILNDITASNITISPKLEYTEKDLAPYITNFIVMEAGRQLYHQIDSIKTINDDALRRFRYEIVEAKKRLEFSPMFSMTIAPWEKSRRLNVCKEAIITLDQAISTAQSVNEKAKQDTETCKRIVSVLIDILRNNPLNQHNQFLRAQTDVSVIVRQALSSYDQFDFEAIVHTHQQVMDITPSEK